MTKKLYLIAIVLLLLGGILFDTTNLQVIPIILIVIGVIMLAFTPLIIHISKYD